MMMMMMMMITIIMYQRAEVTYYSHISKVCLVDAGSFVFLHVGRLLGSVIRVGQMDTRPKRSTFRGTKLKKKMLK
jgi:hypothetical protein